MKPLKEETKLKDATYIEGFDTEWEYRQYLYGVGGVNRQLDIIYQGKTSEISEDLAKTCVKFSGSSVKDYALSREPHPQVYDNKFTGKESIQTACSQDYCIIFKVK